MKCIAQTTPGWAAMLQSKSCPRCISRDPVAKQRFEREAKTISETKRRFASGPGRPEKNPILDYRVVYFRSSEVVRLRVIGQQYWGNEGRLPNVVGLPGLEPGTGGL